MRNPSSGSGSASKTTTPCCSKVGIKRGPWTPEEDELLANYIKKEGEGRWRTLPKRAGLLRCGKSCRLRWMNYLRPSVKRGRIAPDEEDLILRLHRLLGNRWSLIAGRIPGRTDNEIKNYWNTHLSKKLINQGIDPRTHKPLNPNPTTTSTQNIVVAHHHGHPNQNCNPNSFQQLEAGAGKTYRAIANRVSENFTMANVDHQQQNQVVDGNTENWPIFEGFLTGIPNGHGQGNGEDCNVGNGNEDAFTSFLDSLINENVFANQQQQLLQPQHVIGSTPTPTPSGLAQPVVSSAQATFNHSAIWDAEFLSSMAALGNEGGAINSNQA